MLKLQHLAQQALVGLHEAKALLAQRAVYQRLAHKHAVRLGGVNRRVIHLAAVVHQQPVKRGTLIRHHGAALGVVVRLQQLGFEHVAGHTLNPLRLHRGQATAVQARGVHQLSGHHPALGALAQMHPRMRQKLDLPRPGKGVVALALVAHVAQQTGQQRRMQLLVGGRLGVKAPALLRSQGRKLLVGFAPLAHPARA